MVFKMSAEAIHKKTEYTKVVLTSSLFDFFKFDFLPMLLKLYLLHSSVFIKWPLQATTYAAVNRLIQCKQKLLINIT